MPRRQRMAGLHRNALAHGRETGRGGRKTGRKRWTRRKSVAMAQTRRTRILSSRCEGWRARRESLGWVSQRTDLERIRPACWAINVVNVAVAVRSVAGCARGTRSSRAVQGARLPGWRVRDGLAVCKCARCLCSAHPHSRPGRHCLKARQHCGQRV